ncbi:hypothetical protein ES703_53914 [subsurface metagenome]
MYSASYAAVKAIDNNMGTHWFGLAGHCPPSWIYFDLGSKKRIGGVKAAINSGDVPQTHDIQISDDASSWENVVSGWVVSVGGTLKEKTFPAVEGRYIRLYITASKRTYGNCTEFRAGISPGTTPTVTTQAVSNIGTTTATGNVNITDNGGESCSKRGVCWNTTGNPTVADDKSEETGSFGTGAFTRPITGLTPGQHYYVKGYAYNSAGYGYGSQVEFDTNLDGGGGGNPDWLSGWAKRVKLTIDQNDIDAALANFPILVHLGTSVGRNGDDVSFVFDELESDANRKKIAVTTSDGQTQCYVEIEKWVDANEQAWLWVKVPSVASGADTDLYLYYDSSHADNTAYVGDTNSEVAENVWDSDFELVYHMADGASNQAVYDSTSHDKDGTKVGANQPIQTTAGKIGNAQNFDGIDDAIDFGSTNFGKIYTLEYWMNLDDLSPISGLCPIGGAGWFYSEWIPQTGDESYHRAGGDFVSVAVETLVGTWIKRSIVRNGTSVKFYHQGVQVGATQTMASNDDFVVQRVGFTEVYIVDGRMDEVRISSTDRTAAWIKASYESERDHLLDFGSEEAGVPYEKTLTESLGLVDKVVKSPSVMKTEPLGLLDTYSRTWAAYRVYPEILGLSDTVVKTPALMKTESLGLMDTIAISKVLVKVLSELLGLSDTVTKDTSKVLTEDLGLVDVYSRTWNVYRTYSELLGLTDTVIATRLLVKVLTELLGLSDTVKKDTSKMLAENLGLLDVYGRTWGVYRTYDELLGLADSIQKDIALHPLVEPLGLVDSVVKSPSITKSEPLGLKDAVVKDASKILAEDLGLLDSISIVKALSKILSETLGLVDTYERVWSIQRTYTETLGLEDRVSKHVSLHALTEVLGLLDSISYLPNPTILAKLIRKLIQLEDIGGGGEE